MYVAILHFLLPISVAVAISTNSHLSRFLIAAYSLVLGGATLLGRGFLGTLIADDNLRGTISIAAVFLILAWPFGSSKCRYYYALIAGKDLPDDLIGRDSELAGRHWLGDRTKAVLDWFADHLETVVLLGFVAVVIYALMSTG